MTFLRTPETEYTWVSSTWCPLLPSSTSHTFFLQGNNDDLILSCCLHYCKDKAKDFMPTNKGTALPLPHGHPMPSLVLPSSALEKFEDSGIRPGTSLRPAQFPAHLEVRLLCHSSPAPRECQMDRGPTRDGPSPGSQAAGSELSHSSCIRFLSWVLSEFLTARMSLSVAYSGSSLVA